MVKAVFFDMNETMLNIELLGEKFGKYFKDKYIAKYWFIKMLHASTVMGAMEEYVNFGVLAENSLENVFYENNLELTEEIKKDILGGFRTLPAYEDILPSLKRLKEEKIELIAVSNSSLEMINEQLTNAGIIELFDNFYSVDSVKKYKPFNSIYEFVAQKEGLEISDIVMVATHDWDLFGAKKVGLITAYVERKKEIFNPSYPKADIYGKDMKEVVEGIIKIK